MNPQPALISADAAEFEAILSTMQLYIDGGRTGRGEVMRPAFLPEATLVGYRGDLLYSGSINQLFEWIDQNGPAPRIDARFASVEVVHTIAIVRLEVEGWSGKLAGENARMSDVFTLLKTPEGWRITEKTFHWHAS